MPVPVRPVGASAFVARGFWKFSYLRRIGHERVNDTPTETPIKWRRGLGIIGECWETGQVLTVDTGSIDAEYGQCTKEEWEKAPPETRRRRSYEQYVKVRGKYGTVIAAAITKNQKVVGVVALDGPKGYHQQLARPEIESAVRSAAATIRELLYGDA